MLISHFYNYKNTSKGMITGGKKQTAILNKPLFCRFIVCAHSGNKKIAQSDSYFDFYKKKSAWLTFDF